MNCVSCQETKFTSFNPFQTLKRVTSDCKPFQAGGKLTVCQKCGTIQKTPDALWLSEINTIYKNYEVYSQSSGEEQAVFNASSGKPTKRSTLLTQFIQQSNVLESHPGKVLDFGCANGEFLSAFSATYSGRVDRSHQRPSS